MLETQRKERLFVFEKSRCDHKGLVLEMLLFLQGWYESPAQGAHWELRGGSVVVELQFADEGFVGGGAALADGEVRRGVGLELDPREFAGVAWCEGIGVVHSSKRLVETQKEVARREKKFK